MREDKAVKTLQMDTELPEVVQQRAALAFAQIKMESGGGKVKYAGKAARKSMWGVAAAAVLMLGTVAYAAYMHWSYGMQEKLNATQEQKAFLEDNQIATPLNNSVTQEGITVTLQQSIVDSRFAYLSFRVEGYQVREGSILKPAFESVDVTVNGGACGMGNSSFFNNWHITGDERIYTNDGTPIQERKDGTLIERYVNEDGSMEYIILLMTDSKDHSLVGEPVHVELNNLGTLVRYSSAYRKDIDAVWAFDFVLEGSEQVRSLELSQPIGDSRATIRRVEISPVSLYVEYDFPRREVEFETIDEAGQLITAVTYEPAPPLTGVRLKDGTMLTYICNGGSEGKHRITPLSKEIWVQFGRYCEKYHQDIIPDSLMFYSFRNGQKNKMSRDNVSRILDGCETKLRKDNPDLIHLHSHLFRRTRAMHLYQAGVPLPTISEWLGHSNIETTRFYAKVTEEMKREALRKLSDSDNSVFKDDVAFKYANDEDAIKRLCGLK